MLSYDVACHTKQPAHTSPLPLPPKHNAPRPHICVMAGGWYMSGVVARAAGVSADVRAANPACCCRVHSVRHEYGWPCTHPHLWLPRKYSSIKGWQYCLPTVFRLTSTSLGRPAASRTLRARHRTPGLPASRRHMRIPDRPCAFQTDPVLRLQEPWRGRRLPAASFCLPAAVQLQLQLCVPPPAACFRPPPSSPLLPPQPPGSLPPLWRASLPAAQTESLCIRLGGASKCRLERLRWAKAAAGAALRGRAACRPLRCSTRSGARGFSLAVADEDGAAGAAA